MERDLLLEKTARWTFDILNHGVCSGAKSSGRLFPFLRGGICGCGKSWGFYNVCGKFDDQFFHIDFGASAFLMIVISH